MVALLRAAVLGSGVLMLTACPPDRSPVPLGEPEPGVFMPQLVGEWRNPEAVERMWLARYDDDEYLMVGADWESCAGQRVHISRVGDAPFLNIRDDDGFTISRIGLDADRLLLRRIAYSRMDSVTTSAELSAQVASRLNDPGIYADSQHYMRTTRQITAQGEDALALALLACMYDGAVPLGDPRPNTLDARLLGDWLIQVGDTTDRPAHDDTIPHITIRAFNDREYLVTSPHTDGPLRAYLTRLGGAVYVNVQEVEAEGFLVGRVIFSGEEIRIHPLNGGMNGAAGSGQLRARVAKRLDDTGIYWWETLRLWPFRERTAVPAPPQR